MIKESTSSVTTTDIDNNKKEDNVKECFICFPEKLTKVISFYNLTNSEVCSICNISRKTLNELLYENNEEAEIDSTKIDILYNIINDLSIKKDITLNPIFLQPLLKYIARKEIIYTVAKRIVLDIIKKTEIANNNNMDKYTKKVSTKTSYSFSREEEESKKESFLFLKKILAIYPFMPSINSK